MAEVRARKRGDKWEYRFEGAAVDGKRKQYSKSGFRTKKEALEAGAEAFAKYNRAGSIFREKDISFSDYLDYWLEIYVKANLKMTTYELYNKLIRLHVKPRLGQYRLAALKPYVFQEFANTLTEETDLSRTSIHHIISCVHGALSYAVSPLNYIEHNPVVRVKIPESAPKPKHKDVLTLEQFEKVLSYVDKDSPYRLIMIIAMYTGMRENEILSLTWDKVDLDEDSISIVRQIHKNNVSTPKTETSERKIDFGSALHKVLQEERKNQLQNRLKYGKFYTIYKEAGGLDSGFFAHQEEIDLCWRLRSRGYRLVCTPQSTVYHVGGGTLNVESPRKTFLNFRNNLLMLYKNLPEKELRPVMRLRFWLDYIAATKFLLCGHPRNALAVYRARKEFHRLLPEYKQKREENLRLTRLVSIPELKSYSLLTQFYLKGKKHYDELPQ